jgi:hypothetical protein
LAEVHSTAAVVFHLYTGALRRTLGADPHQQLSRHFLAALTVTRLQTFEQAGAVGDHE